MIDGEASRTGYNERSPEGVYEGRGFASGEALEGSQRGYPPPVEAYGSFYELSDLVEEINCAFANGLPDAEDGWDRVFGSRDLGILLDSGWKYGSSRLTIWGTDNKGQAWVVWDADDQRGWQGGPIWYKVTKGVRTRVGSRRYSEVRNGLS